MYFFTSSNSKSAGKKKGLQHSFIHFPRHSRLGFLDSGLGIAIKRRKSSQQYSILFCGETLKPENRSRIPVFIMDEHQEAFYLWHWARKESIMEEPLDLFHIDAHADMGRPKHLSRSIYLPQNSETNYLKYYRYLTENEFSNGTFILPAILNGLIKNVYFIYPDWRNYQPTRKRIPLGSAFGEGKLLKCEMQMNTKSQWNLKKVFPDLKYFAYIMCKIDKIPTGKKVILDIDLDYFACIDSIFNHFCYEAEITQDQFHRREILLNEKTLPYSGIEFHFLKQNRRYFVRVSPKKVKEVSFIPPREKIAASIVSLSKVLQEKRIKPVFITICRSLHSGYCPRELSPFIEAKLLEELQNYFQIERINVQGKRYR